MRVRRCAVAGLVAAFLAAPGAARPAPPPTPPSAPSEYVEVVPTAGGGSVAGSGPHGEGSGSAVGAAADAIASGGDTLIGLAVVLLATTLSVVAVTVRRRGHEPKGW